MIGALTVRDDCFELGDGAVVVVLRAGELDVDALDPSNRAAALAAFATLCHTLDSPLQIVVRLRPVSVDRAEQSCPLDLAAERHRRGRALQAGAHQRDILIAVRAADAARAGNAARRVANALQAMDVTTQRLRRDELFDVVGTPGPLTWRAAPGHVVFGEQLVAGFALRRLPGHAVSAGWLQPLLSLRAVCDIALHLTPASLGLALSSLARRLRDVTAHRMLESERGVVGDVRMDIALDAAHTLRGRLARHHGVPLHLSLTAVALAGDAATLRRSCEQVRSAFSAAMVIAEPLHFRHAEARIATLPLCVDPVRNVKLVDSTAAATCLPWVAATCADPGGYRLGEHRVTHTPVLLAPFDAALHRNANIAVLAASGHGKSFALGSLVIEASLRGVQCIVIDPEGEYVHLARSLGGHTVELTPGGPDAVNIFDCTSDPDDESRVAAVTELVAVLCDRLSEVELALCDRAARQALESAQRDGRAAVLSDCVTELQHTAPRVAAVVGRYCEGALGALFNRPTTMTMAASIQVFSLRDLPAQHMAAATLVIARLLWNLVRRDPRRRHILFDEAGALCEHPALRSLLVQLARRCRKHGASLVVATQNAQDLLATHEGTVVATNCATVLLGGHRAAEAATMERAFGLTTAQRRFLETAGRGEFLLVTGRRRLEMRVDVPEEYAAILRGTATRPSH